jgi:enolase
MTKIKSVRGLEILDSRGNPTVEAILELTDGRQVTAKVPSGASTGEYEALEMRDGDQQRYLGLGVKKALANLEEKIAPLLEGGDPTDQFGLDQKMLDLDGTLEKKNLGANAILAASLAICKAGAIIKDVPLYVHVADLFGYPSDSEFILPLPMMNVLNGGKHAIKSTDMQEYMISPQGFKTFPEMIRAGSEIFHTLGKILKKQGFATTVGDEGGYAPTLKSNQAPLDLIVQAIKEAGYQPLEQVRIALDPAASEFYDPQSGKYNLALEDRQLDSQAMVELWAQYVSEYPIYSLEDGLAQDDWSGWQALQAKLGDKIQLVGDDLLVTNVVRLQKAIDEKACNSILIKVNQIGSVTESIRAIELAKAHGLTCVVSHRSGETEDTFIADFVVGAGAGQIKTGSMSRSDRVAKYNRLLEIDLELGERARLPQIG